ncbi:MAG: extracellular solute-binding protein [Chloroflexota bacterium]
MKAKATTLSGRLYSLLAMGLVILAGVMSGCQLDLTNPPRLATAEAGIPQPTTSGSLFLAAPTATPAPAGSLTVGDDLPDLAGSDLAVWVNEVSPEHEQMMQSLVGEFTRRTGANVSVQSVSPSLLPELVNTAVLSGTLPDIVVHPLEYTAGWAERGILDASAAGEVVADVGASQFDPAALELVETGASVPAAVPLHGYYQLLLYRADWLADRNLSAPDDFASMMVAAEGTFDQEQLVSGIIVPTESNLVTTHQAFEQMALANGCDLINESGEVRLLDDSCDEALKHYYSVINQFSPPGVQTDTSARNAFLNGQTAIIMTSPSILPALAGLDPALSPGCAECTGSGGTDYLAQNTGILTQLSGANASATPVGFGNLTNLGITSVADREAAIAFAEYWLQEGYEQWLSVDPERKVPMLLGTADSPRQYIDAWGTQPLPGADVSLSDIYGADVVAQLRDGIASAPRWGIWQGYGALVTKLYEDLTVSIVLQEMLSGYFNTDTTLREAFRRVVEQIPNYAYSTELPPLPEPEPTAEP